MTYLAGGTSGYRVEALAHDKKNCGVSLVGSYPDGGSEQLIVMDVKLTDNIKTASSGMNAAFYGVQFQVKTLTPWATAKSLTMGGMKVLDLMSGTTYLVQVRFYNAAGKCYTMQMRTNITEAEFDAEVVKMNDWFTARGTVEQQRDIVTAMQALL